MSWNILTGFEKETIENYYRNTSMPNLYDISEKLGRTRQFICRYAGSVGLTRRSRKKYYKHVGCKWTNHKHPRGMLGKTHTEEVRKRLSMSMMQRWKNPNSNLNSEGHKQMLSDRMKKLCATYKFSNPYSRSLKGRRLDLENQFFKSRWEANFARYLNFLKKTGNIHDWKYEAERFDFEKIKRGTRSYLPDFKVWDRHDSVPYFYEVKGWMDDKSRVRLKRMGIYFPHIKVILIGSKEYKDLAKKISALIPEWETTK